MSGFEIVGLVLGAIGLVPMFKEGYVMVKEYRQRQKVKLLAADGSTSTLKDTLEDSSTSVANRYDKFYSSYGTKFSNGDSISHAQLSKIVITLQAEIISALRSALAGGTLEQNASHLNLVAGQGRQEAMAILGQLAQRISTTIAPMLSTAKMTPKYLPSPRVQEIEEDTRSQPSGNSYYAQIASHHSQKQTYPYQNSYGAQGSQAYPGSYYNNSGSSNQYSGWKPSTQQQRSRAEGVRNSLKILGFNFNKNGNSSK
ncbi:hypothetical protein TWF569_009881 [Orbilia oligospora]|uniref:Uncharacterized protein n=1 Tax=Orbilia oligospora TaxID=2813651 RepID=A0A7C8JYA4_ORBOL|nr:hypothetical protein TWF102_006837 [Orbilia oligospora]KAF3103670.1 hypothetical protein TWF103_007178 [Orbilia oligospora]KAF3132496.1 hypothetical protein TWF703_007292 [Orbilia oligospora]KAF3135540.1 hypothetical protein TWF569_009881 [Orbilia oligospora]KAF3142581.1 hypothetical protein TWF594_005470 [Orbilia oligospora]